jgi:DNA-binding response OmpR family regulator
MESSALRVAILDRDHNHLKTVSKPMRECGWEVTELDEQPNRMELVGLRLNLLLANVSIFGGDTTWLTRRAAEMPALAIVAYSESSTPSQRVGALRGGLDAWIGKSCEPAEVLARLQSVARARHKRGGHPRPSILSGDLEIRADRYDAVAGGAHAGLTTREFEVFELLVQNGGTVLEREKIYSGVWGSAVPAGDRSVDIFVSRIRLKLLRISPGWRYLHTHPGVGYRFQAEQLVLADEAWEQADLAKPARHLPVHSFAESSEQCEPDHSSDQALLALA